ncbi:MAG: DUF421 domain-containing protein [Pyrinomonadaceae bacterium]
MMASNLLKIDWTTLLVPSGSLLEIVIRGSVVYLVLFLILRFLLKRDVGSVGIPDLIFVVIIADATQNAMAGEYKSLTEGLTLAGTIFFWNFLLDWLGYKFPFFEKILRPAPKLLISHGQILYRNMRQTMITEDELWSQLRQQGIDKLNEVKVAIMEGDGRISVIKNDGHSRSSHGKS